MAFHAHEEPAVTQETCAAILEKAKLENWAMGKTKVSKEAHFNLIIIVIHSYVFANSV